MEQNSIESLDRLFKSYNYNVDKQSNQKVRIYTLRYGMYHAAEILLLDSKYNAAPIKKEFSELGYATEVKSVTDKKDLEEYLFEGFFIKTPLGSELKNRYKHFVKKQLQNLPEGSTYRYIQSAYDFLLQDPEKEVKENKSYDGISDTPLIEKINELLVNSKGALFIIIEAAAGFGKTCTANEVLNTFSTHDSKKLPFFTELSRNREARVFKHILLNEIDEQFPSGIKQNIVIEQISKGRIPLIIDGFDELISKESNKEEVESMLTTIVDLLKEDAKIIITSRKTAIFNSEEFVNSLNESKNDFSLARFEIKEPTIENWLSKEQIQIIKAGDFPIDQISNPVLLSYLRNITLDRLERYTNDTADGSLIDKYIDYLLKREQVRQNLKLSNDQQLKIFRRLMRFMTEYNITAESKETIKEFLKEFNIGILQESIKGYIAEEKPSIEDLVETLSNHVFLDRKSGDNVGIINDFIFGLLVGENLIYGKYQNHLPEFETILPQDFAYKAVQSFKVQNEEKRMKLWKVFNSLNFNYDTEFFFIIDYFFLKKFEREYLNLYLNDMTFKGISFEGEGAFKNSSFSNLTFEECHFDLANFENCSFNNCSFYNCSYSGGDHRIFNDFGIYASHDNNDFIKNIFDTFQNEDLSHKEHDKLLNEFIVLREFFGIGMKKPKAKKISHLKTSLSEYPSKDLSKIINALKNKDYLYFKDDVGFLSKKGIQWFNLNKTDK